MTLAEINLQIGYSMDYKRGTSVFDEARAGAGVAGSASVKVFGKGGDAASIDVGIDARKPTSGSSGGSYNVKLRVAGKTLFSKSGSYSTKISKSYSKSYSRTWIDTSKTFVVGIVPVVVKATLESSAKLNLTLGLDPVGMSAGARGSINVIPGEAGVSAGVGFDLGVVGASAGVSGALQFATAKLAGDFSANAHEGFGGTLTWSLTAMTLKLSLYAEAFVKLLVVKAKKRWEIELFKKSWGSSTRTLFSF
jgi:hypothetical protein